MAMPRTLAVIVTLVAVATGLTGCAFQDKTAAGRLIHDAPKMLQRAPGLDVTLSVTSQLISRGSLSATPPPAPSVRFIGVVDLRHGLAFYRQQSSPQPSVVFDGNTIYALTPGASAQTARPWVAVVADKKLADRRLDASSVAASVSAAYALRPSLLIDFLDGALTGSIHRVGPAMVGSVPATAYTARFDLSQALTNATRKNYTQREQDDVAKLLSVLSINTGDLDRGEVWLDASGLVRQMQLTIEETPAPQSRIDVTFLMTLTPAAAGARVAAPGPDTVITMPSLFQFLLPLAGSVQSS